MSRFCPCIDLHDGQVKQIVGGTLRDGHGAVENFRAPHPPAHYASMFRKDDLHGGHVIQLGSGNEQAAREALSAWPGGLRIGGGITPHNAEAWLDAGAKELIVTSYLFNEDGCFSWRKLKELSSLVHAMHLVLDLSCRRVPNGWRVTMNRWQTTTQLELHTTLMDDLAEYCAGFLVHAADVEGKCEGIDSQLVEMLGSWRGKPVTYAGGVSSMKDVYLIEQLSNSHVDVTVGSSLDIYGGKSIKYDEIKNWSRRI